MDNDTPSLAIAVLSEYRGKGIGSRLLHELHELLKNKGYKRISLAVQKANYAVRMYKRAGFRKIDENDEEFIMVCSLSDCI